jgi:hypothetical protein
MFGFVLSALWQNGDVLRNDSAAIQQISYNKLRIGLTPDTKKLLISKIDQMAPMGYILKDEETMDYVTAFDGDDSDVSSVMSEWGSIDVCHLIGAPPYWKEPAIKQILSLSDQKDFLLTKMRWSVAEMRFATWKIQAPTVQPLIGKVFRTQAKERQMVVISKEEYKQRRHPRTQSNLLVSNKPRHEQTKEETALSFDFKRKRDTESP